jgi:hypothetical protein
MWLAKMVASGQSRVSTKVICLLFISISSKFWCYDYSKFQCINFPKFWCFDFPNFWFWLQCKNRSVTLNEIKIPTKFHPNFVDISILKSEFRFWFRLQTFYSYFNFGIEILIFDIGCGIEILIPTWESWFRHQISKSMSKFQRIFPQISQNFYYNCVSEFQFRLSNQNSNNFC